MSPDLLKKKKRSHRMNSCTVAKCTSLKLTLTLYMIYMDKANV